MTRITHKQETFAKGVAQGLTLSEAYRQAYDCSAWKKESVWRQAQTIADNPKVSSLIAELKAKQESRATHDSEALRRIALETWLEIAQDSKAPQAARNRAAELIAKVKGVELLGSDTSDKPDKPDMHDLAQQLRAFIKDKAKQVQVLSYSHTEQSQTEAGSPAPEQAEPEQTENPPTPDTPPSR